MGCSGEYFSRQIYSRGVLFSDFILSGVGEEEEEEEEEEERREGSGQSPGGLGVVDSWQLATLKGLNS